MDAKHKQVGVGDAERDALNEQALAEGTTPEKIQRKGDHKEHATIPGKKDVQGLVDGYAVTEGEDYATPQRDEREGYDPAHSGVRRAQNKPGAPTQTPGRDEGTAWSSQEQMGSLRDSYDRKNPAE
jgi:hypothetical protein